MFCTVYQILFLYLPIPFLSSIKDVCKINQVKFKLGYKFNKTLHVKIIYFAL